MEVVQGCSAMLTVVEVINDAENRKVGCLID